MAYKIRVPIDHGQVKEGKLYIKTADGVMEVVPKDRARGKKRGRRKKRELEETLVRSFEVIRTLGAKKGEMHLVAVAFYDEAFDPRRKGERNRLRKSCREMSEREREPPG